MGEGIVSTPEGQGEIKGLDFDESGVLKITESGLKSFQEMLKGTVTDNTVRPTLEEEPPEEETEEVEEEKEPPKTTKKIKVDGQEHELTEEELVALAQQGADYTRKMQKLAAERDAMAPYQALLNQLKVDPNLSRHISDYWKPKEEPKPQFEDPIEQLKWETKQEALAELRKEMQANIDPMQKQQVLNQVRQQVMTDPDYNTVHGAIVNYVNSLPPSLQKSTYLQLDQDPQSYVEAFQHFKMAMKKKPEVVKTEPVKRTEKAPILESSNSAPTEDSVKSQKSMINKAKAKALRSGDVSALQEFLEVGGFLNHLK